MTGGRGLDATLRGLVRAAEADGSGAAWARAALALGRAGRDGEAGRALTRALVAGADPTDLRAALAPPGLEAFVERRLGERYGRDRLDVRAWSADGATLFGVVGRAADEVVAIDAATGDARALCKVEGRVRALAADPDGARLAVASVTADERATVLRALDLASGALGPGRESREWIHELTCSGPPGLVVARTKGGVRALPLDPAARPAWVVTGDAVGLGPDGSAVALKRDGTLALHDPLGKRPRATARLAEVAPRAAQRMDRPDLALAGRGALVRLRLPGPPDPAARPVVRFEMELLPLPDPEVEVVHLGPDGALVRRVTLPRRTRDVEPSPCGRYALLVLQAAAGAGVTRHDTVVLLDLATAATRAVTLDALPRAAAWSPSGRAVAIGTDAGTVTVLDASAAPPPAPSSSPSSEAAWVELRSARQFWRARAAAGQVELRWGLTGTQGQRKVVACDDPAAELARRVQGKTREGYGPL